MSLPDVLLGRKFSTSSVESSLPRRSTRIWAPSFLIFFLAACAAPPGGPSDGGTLPDGSVSSADTGGGTSDANRGDTSNTSQDGANQTEAGGSQPGGELGPERPGLITYYDADGTGNCSFDRSSGPPMVAAMNTPEWNNSAVCGMCARVTGPRGSVTVQIVDRCPECMTGHLDLSREAFALVANPVDGRVNVRWQPVRCAVQGALSYRFKEGSSQWWTGFQVRNHRVPIRTFEVRVGNNWQALERQDYNYFIGTNLGPGPFRLRITSQDGQVREEPSVPLRDATVVPGTVQFD